MAEEIKTTPAPEGQTLEPPAPEVSEAPPAPEPGAQGVIPGMEGPPAPENKVINLSSVRAGQEQTDPAKEGGQEWEKPQEQPEPPRRGRRPKNKEAPAQGEKPKRKGRPPKSEKQAPGGGGAGRPARAPRQDKAAGPPAPAKEEAPPPPAPEQPPQPRDASRAEKEEIVYLDLSQLHPFQNHPFGVRDDVEMEGLVSSVKAGGVHQPALVRPREGGGYEIIAGHRRKRGSELAGRETMPVLIRSLDDDEATIIMVDSNLQREKILPSEKAFAYKMRLEAMKRQGERSDLTSRPVGEKLFSVDKMSQDVADSGRQIHRYIRLTELVPEILQMVDERQIAFRPAVEISYLSEEQQYTLLEAMGYNDATPSLAQAIKMKKFMQEGKLTDEVIQSIMQEDKPNQKEKPAFKDERITKLIPKSIPRGQETDFVVKALEFYNRHLQRQRGQER